MTEHKVHLFPAHGGAAMVNDLQTGMLGLAPTLRISALKRKADSLPGTGPALRMCDIAQWMTDRAKPDSISRYNKHSTKRRTKCVTPGLTVRLSERGGVELIAVPRRQ
jgi:hypothetical protein